MNVLMSLRNYFCSVRCYIVRKGNRHADGRTPMILSIRNGKNFFVQTDSTWVYVHPNKEDQSAINKIVGVSNNINYRINSWMVGYSYSVNDNMLNIYFCEYSNKIRSSYLVKKINIGDHFILRTNVNGGIFLDDLFIGRSKVRKSYCFLLEPRFGDKMKAPHDWKILSIIYPCKHLI